MPTVWKLIELCKLWGILICLQQELNVRRIKAVRASVSALGTSLDQFLEKSWGQSNKDDLKAIEWKKKLGIEYCLSITRFVVVLRNYEVKMTSLKMTSSVKILLCTVKFEYTSAFTLQL